MAAEDKSALEDDVVVVDIKSSMVTGSNKDVGNALKGVVVGRT